MKCYFCYTIKRFYNNFSPIQLWQWLFSFFQKKQPTEQANEQANEPQQENHSKLIRVLTQNLTGKDFVIGDIHACFTAVDHALAAVNFNIKHDRLICVGDLVNRGTENIRALGYLNQPWFYSVLGNHDWVHAFDESNNFTNSRINKDDLKWALSIRTKTNYQQLSTMLRQLPLLIEIQTANGLVGVVHGEVGSQFNSWDEAKLSLAQINSTQNCQTNPLMIGRTRHQKDNCATKIIKGVTMVISGHTLQKEPKWIGNSLFIDTGLVYGLKNTQRKSGLTLIDITNKRSYYFPMNNHKGIIDISTVKRSPLSVPTFLFRMAR